NGDTRRDLLPETMLPEGDIVVLIELQTDRRDRRGLVVVWQHIEGGKQRPEERQHRKASSNSQDEQATIPTHVNLQSLCGERERWTRRRRPALPPRSARLSLRRLPS